MGELAPYLEIFPQSEAVRHAFRVASGLESMVLGETQILGQLKDAVRAASEAGALGPYLNQLFQKTFSVAKQVRGQTQIGAHSVSLASAATGLAGRIFESLGSQRVLLIGAGEMIELCAAHFSSQHPQALTIANRTLERSEKLAQRFGGTTLKLSELSTRLQDFDIVISCTASTLPIIGLGAVERAIHARRHRPMLIIDLAVPRDIEPEVGRLNDVFLYTLDDLGAIVREGNALRQSAAHQAEAIIEARVQNFMHWFESRRLVPVIQDLCAHVDTLRRIEVEQAHQRLARGDDPAQIINELSQDLSKKFLHGPLQALRQIDQENSEQIARFIPKFFRHWIS